MWINSKKAGVEENASSIERIKSKFVRKRFKRVRELEKSILNII